MKNTLSSEHDRWFSFDQMISFAKRVGIASIVSLTLFVSGSALAANAPIKLTLAHSATPDNSLSIAYEKFAEIVKEKSGGQLLVEIHGSGVLASDQTAIDGAKMGIIDMGSCSTSNMASYSTAFWFIDLPFIFKDMDSSHKVLWGEIGEEMKLKASKDIGAKVLFYVDCGGGFRLVVNNKHEVKTPADLKGLKFRVTGSPIELALVKAWGASGTPLPYMEVYTALEQKVVNGENLFPMWVYLSKHYEALKYMTKINALTNPHVALISNTTWNKLSPDLQDVLVAAGKETQLFAAQADAAVCKEMIGHLEKEGLKLYEPTRAETEKWREASVAIWPQFYSKVPKAFIDRVLQAQE